MENIDPRPKVGKWKVYGLAAFYLVGGLLTLILATAIAVTVLLAPFALWKYIA